MSKKILVPAIVVTLLGSAAALVVQAAEQAPQQPMSFFVASTVPGSGNLGGLAGADAICQNLAQAAGAGAKTWHAYLSQQAQGNTPRVNARGRIGPGPWYNAKGALVASNVADLHGDQQRDRNAIRKASALDEKGNPVNGVGDMPNQHDMLTGSDSQGRAWTDGLDHTCNNWTSATDENRATLGHHDRQGGANTSWNSAHISQGCSNAALVRTGGAGKFYCFAIN
jgi:hypothetical protein